MINEYNDNRYQKVDINIAESQDIKNDEKNNYSFSIDDFKRNLHKLYSGTNSTAKPGFTQIQIESDRKPEDYVEGQMIKSHSRRRGTKNAQQPRQTQNFMGSPQERYGKFKQNASQYFSKNKSVDFVQSSAPKSQLKRYDSMRESFPESQDMNDFKYEDIDFHKKDLHRDKHFISHTKNGKNIDILLVNNKKSSHMSGRDKILKQLGKKL